MQKNKNYTLITGGTSGIGLELSKLFAQNGHNLIIVARDQHELDVTSKLLSQYHVDVITMSKDLFDMSEGEELYREIKEEGIEVDILVNNAGQGYYGLFAEQELQRNLDIIHLNISSLVILTHFFIQDMIQKGEGKILNLSSIASQAAGPWNAVYHATKAFVQSFTEGLRNEVKAHNITVTALLPGVTDTDFFNKAGMNESKAVQDEDKMADPADVAKDGYTALMEGKDMVVSGLKNKMQAKLLNLVPDKVGAEQMGKAQEPVNKERKN